MNFNNLVNLYNEIAFYIWYQTRSYKNGTASHPTEAGRAFADVVCGDYNPSARLSISWPVRVGQIPVHYGMRRTGRPHDPNNGFSTNFIDAPIHPRWSFGEGLSYSRYELGDIRADKHEIDALDTVEIEIDISNCGARDGEATLFMFIHDPVALVTRPMLELKDFTKVFLAAGETKTAAFRLRADQLRYPGFDMSRASTMAASIS